MKRLCIFDFDGTLVNTITDVAICFNEALKTCGFKEHPLEQYKNFVGGNLETVVSRLLDEKNKTEENISKVKKIYFDLYNTNNKINTKPYDNMVELLNELQAKNIQIGINTNKKQELVDSLCNKFFPNINFVKVVGYSEQYPAKPNPQGVYDIMEVAESSKQEVVYIGDGLTDIETAKNAGIEMALVTWGQNKEEDLQNKNVNYIVDTANQLRNIIMED